jgi:2-methylisocitrate lyase-like PEP mutase family enzyme
MARTDARAVYGLEEAISRGRDYARAGADLIFLEAPESLEEMKQVAQSIPAPLFINLVEGGKTPLISAKELEGMGYKIASFSGSMQKIALKAMERFITAFRQTGDIRLYLRDMVSLEERSDLLGLNEFYEFEKRFLTLENTEKGVSHGAHLGQVSNGPRPKGL